MSYTRAVTRVGGACSRSVAIGRAVSAFRARPLAVFWSCTELIYFIVRSALGLSWPPTSIYALLRSLYALGSSYIQPIGTISLARPRSAAGAVVRVS